MSMSQQPNHNQEAERLRAAVNDDSLSSEQRDIAAKLLAELERSKPTTPLAMLEAVFAGIDAKVAAYREDQITNYKVCSMCCLKQPKSRKTCELCGAVGKWESPLPVSVEREHCIAATTNYSDEQLNYHVEHTSANLAFSSHCARVLELRGVERAKSFWERGGLDFYGRPRA